MSKRGMDFLRIWINGNIRSEDFDGEAVDERRLQSLALQCARDAEKLMIPKAEIEEDSGPLQDFIEDAINHLSDWDEDRIADDYA